MPTGGSRKRRPPAVMMCAGGAFYLTVFNPGATRKSVTVTIDPRCGITRKSKLRDVLQKKSVRWKSPSTFQVPLDPEDVAVYRIGGI